MDFDADFYQHFYRRIELGTALQIMLFSICYKTPFLKIFVAPYSTTKTKKANCNSNRLFSTQHLGGDKRDRTADLLNAIQALSQLSYTPILLVQRKLLYTIFSVSSTSFFEII